MSHGWFLSVLIASAMMDVRADESTTPEVVRTRAFHWAQFEQPEAIFWPAYFWMWNGPLQPDVLKRQLQDMAAHEAKNVCTLPMPRDFRPDSAANRMDVDYLSPEYFERVKVAVDEAARLGMHYWLYDEGGWPSGQATGRVLGARPDLGVQVLRSGQGGKWSVQMSNDLPDLLNPETLETFVNLTHEKYRAAVGRHFGRTIKLVFTDEPAYPAIQPGREVPWTTGADELFEKQFGYRLSEKVPGAFRRAAGESSADELKTRMDAFDFWSGRFRDVYFDPLRKWSRRNGGMAQSINLGGEDETLGAVKYGFGHVMRQMRSADVPGVDTIWRQVFPGKRNHHFPKFASSAAHQNGTALAMTESFAVYGNGLTPAQMKWMVDYQYVRGLNLLVAGCCPLSTEDHLMQGERPHFGPVDPLWDLLPKFHRYVARLGYVLSCGEPVIETALYYPVRDLWAKGSESPAAAGHDELAQRLSERQVDFDVIDDDLLADPATRIEAGWLYAGKMKYRTIVVGPEEQMLPRSRERLAELERTGGHVVRVGRVEDATEGVKPLQPTVRLTPAHAELRCQMRRWKSGGALMLFHEGATAYQGTVAVALDGNPVEIEPSAGRVTAIPGATRQGEMCTVPIRIGGGESRLMVFGASPRQPSETEWTGRRHLVLDTGWEARAIRQHRVGEHNYEIIATPDAKFQPIEPGNWTRLVGEDYSGRVEYRVRVNLPADWTGDRLRLNLGRVDYAARVRVNGKEVGSALWSPWVVEWPWDGKTRELELSVEVANTLANELTSNRVQSAWSQRSGPGWPGVYHQRALAFEQESRSGGLFGPVMLEVK
jgi:hypothetical protein